MKTKFKLFDNLVSIWEPDKVGTVIRIDEKRWNEPVYTILYPDGNMYAGYAGSFRKVNKDA